MIAPSTKRDPIDTPGRLPWIDWLRFLASFLVVSEHVRGAVFVEYGALPEPQRNAASALFFFSTRLSHEAVLMFFVLSGFLVGGKVLERVSTGTFQVFDYAVDRLTRVYTPLIPALFLSAIVAAVISTPIRWIDFAASIFGLQVALNRYFGGNIPLWTLSFEVWFYILAGCVASVVQNRRWPLIVMILMGSAMAFFVTLGSSMLFCWTIGALGWLTRPSKGSLKMVIFLALPLIAIGVANYQFTRMSVSTDLGDLQRWMPPQSMCRLLPAFGFAIVLQNVIKFSPVNALGSRVERFGTWAAASSYTLYLTHYPVVLLITHWGCPRATKISATALGTFVLLIVVCLVVSWLSFLFFESRTKMVRCFVRDRFSR